MIGQRVRLTRHYLSMNQATLAQGAGVTQAAISLIERGGPVSDATLQAISGVTGYSLSFLKRGPLPELPDLTLHFRRRSNAPRREERRLRAYVQQGLEFWLDLEGDLDHQNIAQVPPLNLAPRSEALDEEAIEDLALWTRRRLGVGADDPIPDVLRVAERAGVIIFGASSIHTYDAVSAWPDRPFGRPVICYSKGRHGDRQRLSVAHEIGHLLLHQYRYVEPKQAEKEAFRFGAAFLIPRQPALESIVPPVTLRTLAWTKSQWGMSIAALTRRAFDLRIISQSRYTSLMKQLSARGWRREEPVRVAEEYPTVLAKMLCLVCGDNRPVTVVKEYGLAPSAARELVG